LLIRSGELVGLLGANGAGKSTLVRLMAGLLKPSQGTVVWQGKDLASLSSTEKARGISYVSQSQFFPYALRVEEIVEMGRHPHRPVWGPLSSQERGICEKAMTLCDVLPFRNRWFHELSGGEKQRVLLASAIAQSPQALLLDEPTLSLDLAHQVSLFELIRKLHKEEGMTVVVATHELNLAGRYLDRLILLKEGKIIADGNSGKVLTPLLIRKTLNVEVEKLHYGKDLSIFVPKQKATRS